MRLDQFAASRNSKSAPDEIRRHSVSRACPRPCRRSSAARPPRACDAPTRRGLPIPCRRAQRIAPWRGIRAACAAPRARCRLAAETGATSKPRRPSAITKPSEDKAAQDLAQRRDADAVIVLQRLQPQFLVGTQAAENDVAADAPIAIVADGVAVFGPIQQRLFSESIRPRATPTSANKPGRADPIRHTNTKSSYEMQIVI